MKPFNLRQTSFYLSQPPQSDVLRFTVSHLNFSVFVEEDLVPSVPFPLHSSFVVLLAVHFFWREFADGSHFFAGPKPCHKFLQIFRNFHIASVLGILNYCSDIACHYPSKKRTGSEQVNLFLVEFPLWSERSWSAEDRLNLQHRLDLSRQEKLRIRFIPNICLSCRD